MYVHVCTCMYIHVNHLGERPGKVKKGKILDTPNLKILQNYNIVSSLKKKLDIDIIIENDANMFALGEWCINHNEKKAVLGITLGTGLGFGLIYNGELYNGGNNMPLEYGLSPFKWGTCEKNISLSYIRKQSIKYYGIEMSPREIELKHLNNEINAINIYNSYGENLGLALSHVINIVDPNVIIFGGGLANAFHCFEKKLKQTLIKHSPSYKVNNIELLKSDSNNNASLIGVAYLVRQYFMNRK